MIGYIHTTLLDRIDDFVGLFTRVHKGAYRSASTHFKNQIPLLSESSHIKYAFSWYTPLGIMNTLSIAGRCPPQQPPPQSPQSSQSPPHYG